jgi:SagB-type dehydrogenase family enzyme
MQKYFKLPEDAMLKKILISAVIILCFISSAIAQEIKPIKLLPPDMKGGKPLMQCLAERKTNRSISAKKLPVEVLSNLFWAACGINRPDSGKRTAPTASNRQEIDVYVAMEEGLYLYNVKAHVLEPVLKNDLRKNTTMFIQPSRSSVAGAPLQLIYVADYSKAGMIMSDEDMKFYSATDTGFIAQNVYLYCASAGLATVVRGLVDRDALAKDMKLRDKQKIVLVQTVGYPEDK